MKKQLTEDGEVYFISAITANCGVCGCSLPSVYDEDGNLHPYCFGDTHHPGTTHGDVLDGDAGYADNPRHCEYEYLCMNCGNKKQELMSDE